MFIVLRIVPLIPKLNYCVRREVSVLMRQPTSWNWRRR